MISDPIHSHLETKESEIEINSDYMPKPLQPVVMKAKEPEIGDFPASVEPKTLQPADVEAKKREIEDDLIDNFEPEPLQPAVVKVKKKNLNI